MKAIIYQPAKTAMQSGRGKTEVWTLEFDRETARRVEPLMGWTAGDDMRQQIRLEFESEAAAIAYCDAHGLAHEIRAPHRRRVKPKSYSENFSYYSLRGPGTKPLPRP